VECCSSILEPDGAMPFRAKRAGIRRDMEREDHMSRRIRPSLLVAVAALSVAFAMERAHAQSGDPNAAPNPYKMQENWAHYPDGHKVGAAIKVQVDHSDGKSIWVFDRCGANDCSGSSLPPLLKFDAAGKFVTGIGAGVFNQPHGLFVDRDGNVYAADQVAKNGKGNVVVKFSPKGETLMTLGKLGQAGSAPDLFDQPSAVAVAPNGDIYVADGHGGKTNDRIVKFSKDGKFVMAFGKHGDGPGELDTPHGIALDSAGRVYVGSRVTNRIDIFEGDGKYVTSWKQFGRPSDVVIDKNDMLYVADSQSDEKTNPGFRQGIRIGSVKDGKVVAFIPLTSPDIGAAEGLGVDDAGNVYGGWTQKTALRRFVKN
jgi:sugar lactone lactonase YvrE